MGGLRSNVVLLLALLVAMAALYGLSKSISYGCAMTYMYPTYVPITTRSGTYGLFLYPEGWSRLASTSTSSGSVGCGFFSFRAMAAATCRYALWELNLTELIKENPLSIHITKRLANILECWTGLL